MYRVLIADDENAVCRGLARLIDWEGLGFTDLLFAQNGEEAYKKAHGQRVDLVITDIRMPVIDGLALAKMLRREDADLPIILLSAYRDFDYAREAMEYGVRHYLLKPVNKEMMLAALAGVKSELDALGAGRGRPAARAGERGDIAGSDALLAAEIDGLREAALLGDEKGLAKKIDALVERIFLLPQAARAGVLTRLIMAVSQLARHKSGHGGPPAEPVEAPLSPDGIRDYLYTACSDMMAPGEEAKEPESPGVVDSMKAYIKEHYGSNISITTFAGKVYMSPVYLGRLFKSATGMGFSEYLLKTRMEQAKRLLADTDCLVYEVCDMTGYKDLNYFYKSFKGYTGVTPSEYRRQSGAKCEDEGGRQDGG